MDNIQRSKMLFKAADESFLHSKDSFTRSAWNMAIRRSQEAVELELTATLALIGVHYPKDHDQAPLAMRVVKANGFDIADSDSQKIEFISIDLSRKRGPALHQEEGYDKETAEKAISDTNFVFEKIEKLKQEILEKIDQK